VDEFNGGRTEKRSMSDPKESPDVQGGGRGDTERPWPRTTMATKMHISLRSREAQSRWGPHAGGWWKSPSEEKVQIKVAAFHKGAETDQQEHNEKKVGARVAGLRVGKACSNPLARK
jgi:hypothetical protein